MNANQNYTELNAAVVDSWVEDGWEWGKPVSEEVCRKARHGEWNVLLTPTKPVPHEWFPPLEECRLLGLASGGGQQMPVFSLLGANCTVLDYSLRQLKSEEEIASREGYAIEIVRADMTQPFPFADASFDCIFHPVSNCYVEKVEPVWRECFRVLKPGGVLLAGVDNGMNYLFDEENPALARPLPFNPLLDEELYRKSIEQNDGIQFSHTTEEQLRPLLRAGFSLLDLYEDTNGYGILEHFHVPTFLAFLAKKPL